MYAERIANDVIAQIDELEMSEEKKVRKEIVERIANEKLNVCIRQMKKVYNISDQLVYGQQIDCHMEQHHKGGGHDDHSMMMMDGNHVSNGNLGQYDKLFNEGCLIYDTVDDEANSVLFTVYKIIFKHWSEILRLKVINPATFELIQADIEFFRSNIPKIVEKKKFKKLQTLLDEIQQSAKERCVVMKVKDKNDDNDNEET